MFHLQIVSEQLKSMQWLRLACKWLVSRWGQLLSRTRSPCHLSMETLSERQRDKRHDAAKESKILQHFSNSLWFASCVRLTNREKDGRIKENILAITKI